MTIWVETHKGLRAELPDLPAAMVDIYDIAHSLANQCRYNGHCARYYSVAQHSVLAADLLKPDGARPAMLGLLHDAAEAYIGDVTRPVKALLPDVRRIEQAVQRRILSAMEIDDPTEAESDRVQWADEVLLATEAMRLMPSAGRDWALSHEPRPELLVDCWSPPVAQRRFLGTYFSLRRRLDAQR
jgi:hypothetical protein